jgi:serine/threonine protein kinase
MSDPSEASPELAAFGKYLLDEELARGGMSRVFRARLRGPGGFEKKLVVKQILPELAKDPDFIQLFVQEANTLVQLSHPNLVPVYELGVVDGVYFLAMEWVDGATVSELLREGPLPEALAAQIGAQIAEALRYAHERFQIVHRDVTPRNIIVDAAGHARLLDFGIAARAEQTGQGELFGSPGYMAPEQLRGEALGPQSDLFSLGTVLYEAVSGKQALPVEQTAQGLIQKGPPAPLPELDTALNQLMFELLATECAARPQNAGAVAERLRTWLSQHHPRGVQQELSERAVRAQLRAAAEPRPLSKPPPSSSSGRIEVRSIAVNPQLTQLLQHATERLERPKTQAPESSGPERMAEDPEFHSFTRRFIRDLVVITVALIVALLYARYKEDEDIAALAPPAPPLQPTAASRAAATPKPNDAPAAAEHAPDSNPAPQPPNALQPTAAAATPEPAPEVQNTPPTDVAKKSGSLTISAAPWADVKLDGREVGTTPRRAMPVRPGKHILQLSCPPLAHEARIPVDVKPGQELHVTANMHEDPPSLEVH